MENDCPRASERRGNEAGSLAERLKQEALRLGFSGVGIAPAVAPDGLARYLRWLELGHAAGMDYLRRQQQARSHPENVLEGVRSVVMVSLVYGQVQPLAQSMSPTRGLVARYALGRDYHRVLWDRLEGLLAWLKRERPDARGRAVADTAPLLERDFARLSGLGWIGKNTMLISPRLGSFTFLGALLVDVDLEPDEPFAANHCGTCTRCLDACPTDAFAAPYNLDARRCISYWTIEHKGPIPDAFADQLDGWVFGCDVCQDVCPWNRKPGTPPAPEFQPQPEWTEPDLIAWLGRDRETWRALLKGTAQARARRAGLLRNAALVLGTRRVAGAEPALRSRLDDPDEDPTVRAAAAWALGRLATTTAREALKRHANDAEPTVQEALARALGD